MPTHSASRMASPTLMPDVEGDLGVFTVGPIIVVGGGIVVVDEEYVAVAMAFDEFLTAVKA